MIEQVFVFVYVKKIEGIRVTYDEVKVLPQGESSVRHETLIKQGWKHTATLDACVWIEYLCMSRPLERNKEIKKLIKG